MRDIEKEIERVDKNGKKSKLNNRLLEF